MLACRPAALRIAAALAEAGVPMHGRARLFGVCVREAVGLRGSLLGRAISEGHGDDWHLGKENSESALAYPRYRVGRTPIGVPLK